MFSKTKEDKKEVSEKPYIDQNHCSVVVDALGNTSRCALKLGNKAKISQCSLKPISSLDVFLKSQYTHLLTLFKKLEGKHESIFLGGGKGVGAAMRGRGKSAKKGAMTKLVSERKNKW